MPAELTLEASTQTLGAKVVGDSAPCAFARAYRSGVWILFPALVAWVTVYNVFLHHWGRLYREDGPIENLQAAVLGLGCLLALSIALRIGRTKRNHLKAFFLGFSCMCFLGAMEEISWGQRLFHIQSPAFFLKYNDQRETNVHNTLSGVTHIETRYFLAVPMFILGVVVPVVAARRKDWKQALEKRKIALPPKALTLGFLTSCLLLLHYLHQSRETGELALYLCFLLFMVLENHKLKCQSCQDGS